MALKDFYRTNLFEDFAPDDYGAPSTTPVDTAPVTTPPVVQQEVTSPLSTVQAADTALTTPTGGLPVTQDVSTVTTPNNQLSGIILGGDSWLSGDEKTNIANNAFGQTVTNTAIGGQKTSDVLNQLNQFEGNGGTFAPGSTVVLSIGGNDLANGVDRNTVTKNLNEIVSRLGTNGVKVILSGAPNADSYDDAIASTNLQMDSLYNDVAKNNSNVTLVDSMSGFLNQKDLMDASGFHLKDDASKTAFINTLQDAYESLSPTAKAAVDNKLATIDTSDIVAVAKAVDDVAGTKLASTTVQAPIGGLPTTKAEDTKLQDLKVVKTGDDESGYTNAVSVPGYGDVDPNSLKNWEPWRLDMWGLAKDSNGNIKSKGGAAWETATGNSKTLFDQINSIVKTPGMDSLISGGATEKSEGGLGSKEAVQWDMASKLAAQDVTNLSDLKTRTVDDGEGGQTTEIYNVKTGKPVVLQGTTLGNHQTNYSLQSTKDGFVIPTSSGTKSDFVNFRDAVTPIASLAASVMFPAAAPYIQGANAAYQASKGNWTGAVLSGLSSASGFAGGVMAEIDALANAGRFAEANALYESSMLAQNASNINLAKTGVAGLDALNKGNISGVINAGVSGLNQAGVTLPSGVTTALQLANLTSALSSNNLPAALNAAGDLTGSSNAKIAASALNVVNLMQNPNADPTAVMNAVTSLSNNVKTSQPTTTSGLTGTKVSDAGVTGDDEDVNSLINDFSTKFAGIEGNPTTQVAGALSEMPGEKPSWLKLDKGEKIIGKDEEVGTGDKATYLVQIDNPDDPDKPFIYQTYFDPKTGQTMYAPYGSMKTGGENLGENVLIQSLGFKPTKPIPDWTASDAEKGLPSTVKPTDETFNKTGKTGGLPVNVADLTSVLKTDGSGAKADSALTSTLGGVGGDASKSTVVGGLGGGDDGTTGAKGVKGTAGTGTLGAVSGADGTGGEGKGGLGTGDGGGGTAVTTTSTGDTVISNGDGTTTTVVVVDDKVTTHDCLEGYHWDEATKSCVKDTVVTPPVVVPPVVVKKPVTASPLSSMGTPAPKLDSSEQMLKGAPPQKRMQLAKLQQLFASLTPEMAAVLTDRGFAPPKYKQEEEAPLANENTSEFGNLSDELYKPKFMATGGSIFESMMPKFIDSPKYLTAAPVTGTGGIDAPLKLASLKHLYQSVGKPMKALGGYAQGGLPTKYAKAAPKGHNPEFITGLTGYYAQGDGTGQSDDIPAMLHDGDYVIDADAVAALGDGSSKAGAEALSQFQNKVPHKMSAGGQAVPAKIADGEYVFPEAFVTAIGGGDNKQGAKRLDAMREELRAHKRSAPTSKIPPKAKSPLDYLRMAKG